MLSKTKKKSTRLKQPTVAKLKKKADAAFSLYIRYRKAYFDRGEWLATCVTCGDTKRVQQMQCGHFVSRRVTTLRYDERNCNVQCPKCNVWNHGELYLYGVWLDNEYGEGTAQGLMDQRFSTHKLTISELERIISDSNQKVKEIKGNKQ